MLHNSFPHFLQQNIFMFFPHLFSSLPIKKKKKKQIYWLNIHIFFHAISTDLSSKFFAVHMVLVIWQTTYCWWMLYSVFCLWINPPPKSQHIIEATIEHHCRSGNRSANNVFGRGLVQSRKRDIISTLL